MEKRGQGPRGNEREGKQSIEGEMEKPPYPSDLD